MSEENDDFWLLVIKVEFVLIILVLTFLVLGYFSRNFRVFVVWFIELRIRGRGTYQLLADQRDHQD